MYLFFVIFSSLCKSILPINSAHSTCPSSDPYVRCAMYKLSAELRAHTSDVRGVAVSPAGLIATCSRDKTIAIWHSRTPEPQTTLKGHDHFVNDLTFVNSDTLVSASTDRTLRVWNVKTARCVATLVGHEAAVCAVAPCKTADAVVSASWDHTVRVWDVESAVCKRVLKGHEAAVWSVICLSNGRFVSVGADKTVRIWPVSGDSPSIVLPVVHSDVVRDISLAGGGFVTVANDSSLAWWRDRGEGFEGEGIVKELHGGSYVYSVDSAKGRDGKWMFVTGGEDNSVKVSCMESDLEGVVNVKQTVMHPGTVWAVAMLPNSEFVSACSDGVARVFTCDPERVAEPDVLAAFEKVVSERQVSTKLIGGVDVAKLPDVNDGINVPGKKDGENKIMRNKNGKAEVYMWSASEDVWTKVGDVVDDPNGASAVGPGIVAGKSYDFVFDVEVGQGGKNEKLGYNRGENPYTAAQRFIDNCELSQEFLDQIAQFIENQVPADALVSTQQQQSDPLTGSSRYVPSGRSQGGGGSGGDPLTGASRYVPRDQACGSGAEGRSDPWTGSSRHIPGGSTAAAAVLPPPRKLIPYRDGFISYKSSDQIEKILQKIRQFNDEFAHAASQVALTLDEDNVILSSLMEKLKIRGGSIVEFSDEECGVVGKLMTWPTSHIFPVLDVARMVINIPSASCYFFERQNSDILEHVLRHMASSDANGPVYIMGCRFLCNMFGNGGVGNAVKSKIVRILECASVAGQSGNRRARETFASLLINYAVMLLDSKANVADKEVIFQRTIALVLGGEKDEEVLYRIMIAMGTLLCEDVDSARKGVELGAAKAAADVAPFSARLQQIALEIATIIAC